MSDDQQPADARSPSRRSTLQAVGTLLATGGVTGAVAAQQDDGSYRITQADQSLAVEPLSGDRPVEALYSYRLPDQFEGVGVHDTEGGPYYESAGTRDLQRESTTITFLYDGPDGLSLVTVHGKASNEAGGGSVTWDVAVDADDADWLVRDDQYWERETGERAASNFDTWDVDGDRHRIDWTWSGEATDGGVLGYLDEASAVRIDPSYNESAALYEEHYEGDVTDWQFLSGDAEDPQRVALALGESLGITGPAGDLSAVPETGTGQDGRASGAETATETDETADDGSASTGTESGDETDGPEARGGAAEEPRDGDDVEAIRDAIRELREGIQERQDAIADAAGDGPEALREEIAALRERIEELREELREEIDADRGDFFEANGGPGVGRGNGRGRGR